ncbi:hypothetical protein EAO71_06280 [Streptomyces sp. ms191]|uniref:hypothetical protein n=1 Tax=unclassified Streptomyces TaxID=2593676 RepID=UPI0011CE2EA2|nr:hypothetical protein [Streptomyces sp. ms191]TXS31740.1 hypothetical protein EAO71_06280 [Streptomyces sp. ms191]
MDHAEDAKRERVASDGKKKRLDLSVAQVSASAVAAVVAAKLASTLGVYGTILGAGLISVIATCGGSFLQHLFRRTGEQIREVAVHGEPVRGARTARVPVGARQAGPAAGPDRNRPPVEAGPPYGEEFGAATTHGTRVRGWKRSAVAAALVFLVSMGGITAYELISDQDFSGTKGSTTFGSVVRGQDGAGSAPSTRETPEKRQDDGAGPTPGREGEDGGPSRDTGGDTPEPEPTPSDSADPTPEPSATPSAPSTTPAPTPPETGTPSAGAPAGGTPAG